MALSQQNRQGTRQAAGAVQEGLNLPKGLRVLSPFPFEGQGGGGMNQTDSRLAIADFELFYIENLLKIGRGRYRSLYAPGPALFGTYNSRLIISFFWFNIGFQNLCMVFYNDGTADQIDTAGNIRVVTATPGTFYHGNGTPFPACCQSGTAVLLIANNNTADDYWIWDGTLLYGAGTLGPLPLLTDGGFGYTSTPTVTAFGGTGAGAAFSARISGGQVVAVDVLNPGSGYSPGDSVQLAFSGGGTDNSAILLANISGGTVASVTVVDGGTGFSGTPLLTITGGGGVGATATATVVAGVITGVTVTNVGEGYVRQPAVVVQTGVNNAAAASVTPMPFGVSGYTVEVFTGRVFVGPPSDQGPGHLPNGGTFFVSAPGSLTDFATSDGGLLFTTADRFLRATYTNFRQSNGYLYPFGDSSIAVVSNVQTSGSPPSTTFTYQNIDPQTGTLWRDTCQDFARTILFANPFGVFGLYGGAVTKLSQKIDRIFQDAIFPTSQFPDSNQPQYPCAAVANLYNIKCYVLLLEIRSILDGVPRKHLLIWNERDWCLARIDNIDLTYIGTQEIASNLTAWGTDGKFLYPLFKTPSAAVKKTISTKLYGTEKGFVSQQAMTAYVQAVDKSGKGVDFELIIDTEMGSYPIVQGAENGFKNWSDYVAENAAVPPPIPPVPDCPLLAARGLDVVGQELGFTLVSNSEDFELYNMQITALEVGSVYG